MGAKTELHLKDLEQLGNFMIKVAKPGACVPYPLDSTVLSGGHRSAVRRHAQLPKEHGYRGRGMLMGD
ncbi:hypothetical protein [Oryza sativa Japonica Group]|uniref:Uncharacterized protein B1146F03.27 n=1 Tax=Oryza sativa subsp. japonica TaxID=39947 RepID=Q657I5_ORYSJ|nr:hypothetical protein [Oryza sativa Japonica Group]